jgi:hypothetical protein
MPSGGLHIPHFARNVTWASTISIHGSVHRYRQPSPSFPVEIKILHLDRLTSKILRKAKQDPIRHRIASGNRIRLKISLRDSSRHYGIPDHLIDISHAHTLPFFRHPGTPWTFCLLDGAQKALYGPSESMD